VKLKLKSPELPGSGQDAPHVRESLVFQTTGVRNRVARANTRKFDREALLRRRPRRSNRGASGSRGEALWRFSCI